VVRFTNKWLAFVFVVGLVFAAGVAQAVTIGYSTFPDEQYVASQASPGKGYMGYQSANAFELRMSTSNHVQYQVPEIYRNTNPPDLPNKITLFKECRGDGRNCTPRLGKSDENFRNRYVAVLSGCRNENETNCVVGLSTTGADGKTQPGTLLLNDFAGENLQNYTGNPSIDLPDGKSSFLVDLPGAPHAGGTKYLVVAELTSEMNEGEARFAPARLHVGIFAATVNYGQYPLRNYVPTDYSDAQHPFGASWKPSPYGKITPYSEICIQHNSQMCIVPQKLPLDVSFNMTLKISVPIVGWFHGRVTEASLKVDTSNSKHRVYEVSAKPVIVPMVAKWKKIDELTPNLKNYYLEQPQPLGGSGDIERSYFTKDSKFDWSLLRQQTDFNENGMREFLLWLENMEDKSVAAPTLWSLRSMDAGNNSCYSSIDNIVGIVQTNATSYISGPPQFNQNEQSLDYKVGGPHFLSDGNLNRGSYDLLINKKVAQCIYGFDKAPTKATVSILSADGKETAETVILSEQDEWIKLRASGFSYSSPTLRVKLTAPTVVLNTPQTSQNVAPSSSNPLILTPPTKKILKVITCEKGSKTKFIEGKNPKCPKGYKLNK
jgi:hypothetical protein